MGRLHWAGPGPDLVVPTVVVLLHDIRDVNVEEEKVRYFGKGYVAVLRFATGFSHPLTQSAVMGHRRCERGRAAGQKWGCC